LGLRNSHKLFKHSIPCSDYGEVNLRIFQYISNKMQRCTVYFIWKLLYMFRVVLPPIIRSANNCMYSIWHLSHRYCYLPLAAGSSNGVTNIRWYHPKRVEQFPDKIKCVKLHLVGYILKYSYDARTHEC
jgi:hypothetical protein